MAFKKSNLKNWTVKRDVGLGEDNVTITVRVMSKKDGEAILAKGSDLETVKGFVTVLEGYQDEKGKELGLEGLIADHEAEDIPPTIVSGIAVACVNAQYDAAIKN